MIQARHIIIIVLILCPIIILLVGVFKEIQQCIIGGIIGLFVAIFLSMGIMVHTSNNIRPVKKPFTEYATEPRHLSFEVKNPLPV
jgi:uncharacterized membrane protein